MKVSTFCAETTLVINKQIAMTYRLLNEKVKEYEFQMIKNPNIALFLQKIVKSKIKNRK